MFDRFIKFLYYFGWYFVGMATFSYATRLSDILEDDNLLQVCKICENVLIREYNYNLTELKEKITIDKFYRLSYLLKHNRQEFKYCCEIFYHMKIIVNFPLTSAEEIFVIKVLKEAIFNLGTAISFGHCAGQLQWLTFNLTPKEIAFINELHLITYYYKECEKVLFLSEPENAPQSQPTKTSCTLL